MALTYETAFNARIDLQKYAEDALALFALQLRFQIEDIDTVATGSLTGKATQGDDKKCDLIYVDKDAGYVVVIQTYIAQSPRPSAKANKASDLNTAAAWLLNSPLQELPTGLQSATREVRTALEENSIRFFQFWYVHNLPESENVKSELGMVEQTANNAIKMQFPNSEVESVSAIEVGQETLDEWYRALEAPILITDTFQIPIDGGYSIAGNDWESFVTAIPITWLHDIFRRYSDQLFSANVRDYLGSRKSGSNINNGIKTTAKDDPSHFWVFNNGITVLVSEFKETELCEPGSQTKSKVLEITGISIVNGAQTTGALGSLQVSPNLVGKVQARFVKCSNINTIRSIIEYNNRQNVVEASDFRSNDPIQRRLREEFRIIPDTSYYGGRRGGYEDVIRRPSNLLPSDTVAQALAAFHQDPVVAYNNKSDIWKIDTLYTRYFTERTSAAHIVFAYSLLRGIEAKKRLLIESNKNGSISEAESQQLDFLQRRGAHFILTSAIAKCIETFIGKPIPDSFKVSFARNVSPQEAEQRWVPIIEVTIPFCNQLLPAVERSLKSNDEAVRAINNFKNIIESIKSYHQPIFQSFASHVHIES
jgi:hypothetical protein